MNLSQIRERINNELRYSPNSQSYKDDVVSVINDVYQAICGSQKWTFLEHIIDFPIYSNITVTVTSQTGEFIANFTEDIGDTLQPGDDEHHYTSGHTFVTAGGDEYAINRGGASSSYLHIPDTGAGTNLLGTGTIRFDRYILPYDCIDVLGIVSRTDLRGEVFLVDRSAERHLLLNPDDSPGLSLAFILDNAQELRGPRQEVTAASDNGDTLTAGTYTYFYVFKARGLLSPISNRVSFTSDGTDTAELSGFEDTEVGGDAVGIQKLIYRDNAGDGIFRYASEISDGTVTLIDTDFSLNEDRVWDDRGPARTIRFYPRPSTDRTLELRYLRKPRRLAHENDVPFIPVEFHELLVHRVMEQIAARSGGTELLGLHRRLGDELENRMKRRYLTQSAANRARNEWGLRVNPRKLIKPTVTFNGT